MAIKYLRTEEVKNKIVLLRMDVNVPLDKKTGQVADSFRIEAVLPTIKHLRNDKNKIILCGHLGRPEGKRDEKYTLKPVAQFLAGLLDLEFLETDREAGQASPPRLVFYTGNLMEDKHQRQIKSFLTRDLVFLENLRFYPGEEQNDPVFARKLADLAEVYVNDAFGVDHRRAASVAAVDKNLPSFAGLLLEREIKSLDVLLRQPRPPFVAMMGGIKISDKVLTIENLGKRTDALLVGGGIANLFFLAKGYEVGLSKVESESVKTAWQLEKNFKGKIILPQDVVVANQQMDKDSIRVVEPHLVGKKELILDCGPKTILTFAGHLKNARTIVWNGPLGLFEVKPFHTATMALARVIGGVAGRTAFAVVGGGETVDAVREAHQFEHLDHVSTGGGAMLEYLAGEKLPGIEALK